MHCILPLIHSGRELRGCRLKKTYLLSGPLSSISNFSDMPFHASVTWFGNSYDCKGIEKDIYCKVLIYFPAFSSLLYFGDIFLSYSIKCILDMMLYCGKYPHYTPILLIYAL